MKGKKIFTISEIEEIKKLIVEKLRATADRQKGIRNKIRKIGFYYSDFDSSKEGYTVADLDSLIRSGRITVLGRNVKPVSNSLTTDTPVSKPTQIVSLNANEKTSDLKEILEAFKTNGFDPLTDSETKIPGTHGNYILCLKSNSKLPPVSVVPSFSTFDKLDVIYTGIARGSLRSRDYRQHFRGNNAGRSTLRKSLGVLFGYKQIPRDSDLANGKTKFADTDEATLTEWMNRNLIMYFLPNSNFDQIELELIAHFNPPLNLKGNNNIVNKEFRQFLSGFRKSR